MRTFLRFGKAGLFSRPEENSAVRSAIHQTPGYAVFVKTTRGFAAWMRTVSNLKIPGRTSRRLRLAESISLGEKRFVAIVEVDGMPLLLGGSSTGVVLLKELGQQPAAPNDQFRYAMDEARSREGSAWLPQ